MPIYEYLCQGCGHQFEKLRTLENRDMVSCPDCGARATRKISVVNHTFGWRLTDESHNVKFHKDELERNI